MVTIFDMAIYTWISKGAYHFHCCVLHILLMFYVPYILSHMITRFTFMLPVVKNRRLAQRTLCLSATLPNPWLDTPRVELMCAGQQAELVTFSKWIQAHATNTLTFLSSSITCIL